MIDPQELIDAGGSFKPALGRSYLRYEALLLDRGLADFAHLQRWTVELVEECDEARQGISAQIRQLMCDEYQDTSYAQEQLLLQMSRVHGNICVVGDEDQSLYRFRGARVENILLFPDRFDDCRVVELTVNYRSHPIIVRAYGRWMASADWSNPDQDSAPFRYDKTITPHQHAGHDDYPAVIAIEGEGPADEGEQLVQLLRFLKRRGVINDFGPNRASVAQHERSGGRPIPGRVGRRWHSRQRLRGRRECPRGRGAPGFGGVCNNHPPVQGVGMGRGGRRFAGFPQSHRGPGGACAPASRRTISVRAGQSRRTV